MKAVAKANTNIVNNTDLPDTTVKEVVQKKKTVNEKRSRHTNEVKPWEKSPIANPNGFDETEKQEYMRKIMRVNQKYLFVDYPASESEAQQRIADYFNECHNEGLHPVVEGLALCLGTNTRTLLDWEHGVVKTPPVSSRTIKKAKQYIGDYDALLAAEGKMNPVFYIFRAKNFYGLKDQQDVVVTPGNQLGGEDVAEAERILDALPEDGEETT